MTFAVIRLRGSVNMNKDVKETLSLLRLKSANHCVLVDDSPSYRGMLKKVENWVTWGEVSEEMGKRLKEREGNVRVFRLSPPSKGLKSIKLRFPKGDLGYRGEKINELLGRMA